MALTNTNPIRTQDVFPSKPFSRLFRLVTSPSPTASRFPPSRVIVWNCAADSGIPTELMAEYHARRAAGGAGLIIPQGTPITPKHGMARRTWDVCPRTVGRLEVTAPRGWLHISAVVARCLARDRLTPSVTDSQFQSKLSFT